MFRTIRFPTNLSCIAGLACSSLFPAVAAAQETEDVNVIVVAEVQQEADDSEEAEQTEKKKDEKKSITITRSTKASPLWLGITLRDVEGDLAAYLGSKNGIFVDSVFEGSPAQKAGLQAGDILLSVGDQKLDSPASLLQFMSKLGDDGGQEIQVGLLRNGQELHLGVTPQKRPKTKNYTWTAGDHENLVLDLSAENAELHELLGKLGNQQVKLLRLGKPQVMLNVGENSNENIDVNIVKNVDGEKIEVTVKRKNDEPAEITINRDGDIKKYKAEDLAEVPEEIRVVVEPILHGKRQLRIFSGDNQGAISEQIVTILGEDGQEVAGKVSQELAEKYQALAKEMAEKSKAIAEQARAQSKEMSERAAQMSRSVRARTAKMAESSEELKALQDLVQKLQNEVQELRKALEDK